MKDDKFEITITAESLWTMVMSTHKEIATLVSDYKHIKEKINSIDDKVNVLVDHEYRIKNTEKKISKISENIEQIYDKANEFENKFISQEERNKIKTGVWMYIANNWHKIAIIGGGLAAILDFVYKIDPKA